MRKFVVISVNENPEYLFYVPLVVWAWRKLGWEPLMFKTFVMQGDKWQELKRLWEQTGDIFLQPTIKFIEGYDSSTQAQISRLYAACVKPFDYIMTSDVDMLPLSDYWKFDPEKITVWGHDLTGYQHMPICYIGMKGARWIEVMGLTSDDFSSLMKRDLDNMPNAKSEDQVKRWVVDQDLITERINAVQFEKEFVHRGVYENGYPIGRVDRSAWKIDLEVNIDCHLPRGGYSDWTSQMKIMDVLYTNFPDENFSWVTQYITAFKNLIK